MTRTMASIIRPPAPNAGTMSLETKPSIPVAGATIPAIRTANIGNQNGGSND